MNWKSSLELELQQRLDQKLGRQRVMLSSPQGTHVIVDSVELINFCSNDYLSLANEPRVVAAGEQALSRWGAGAGASHLICGHNQLHHELEERLADFVGAKRALVFSTGYMANLAIPQTFLDRHDLLLQDKLNHASLLDAGRIGPAQLKRYAHADTQAAEKIFSQSANARKMLMTDGVFSMDGDVAPLRELHEICRNHRALLVVDDAHGFGLLGPNGGGSLQQAGIPIRDDLLMVGTLGKACGTAGAFVAGDRVFIETLLQKGRSYIYTTAMPPVLSAMTIAAIDLLVSEPERRERLQKNVEFFRRLAAEKGIPLSGSQTAIQPIFAPVNARPPIESANGYDRSIEWAIRTSGKLRTAGIWITPIRPPTVPAGQARLRVTLNANHTTADIEKLVVALAELI